MSAILAELNAGANSGTDVIIRTLELTCAAWPEPVYICNGFEDVTAITEDNREITFTALNIDIALAGKNNKGNQVIGLAVDNTTGEVSKKIDEAEAARARVDATYRTYTNGNLSAPAEKPYHLVVLQGTLQGVEAQLQSGFFNMIGVSWPRKFYTVNFAPGLRYIN